MRGGRIGFHRRSLMVIFYDRVYNVRPSHAKISQFGFVSQLFGPLERTDVANRSGNSPTLYDDFQCVG